MSGALKKNPNAGEVARRRLGKRTGGLGYLAAQDFMRRQLSAVTPATCTPVASRYEQRKIANAQRVARERQAMIESGQIKPVVQ